MCIGQVRGATKKSALCDVWEQKRYQRLLRALSTLPELAAISKPAPPPEDAGADTSTQGSSHPSHTMRPATKQGARLKECSCIWLEIAMEDDLCNIKLNRADF